jgi:selenocysteine lyase/cysteine desulfurase
MKDYPPHKNYCSYFTGLDVEVPLLNGGYRRYINFDNAASTPALTAVQDSVNRFLDYYSSVHRGTGFKSQLSTHIYERARQVVMDFVGADPQTHTCIFGKNTTEALNKLASRFPFTQQRDILLTSGMEHHSNDLPWRGVAEVIHIGVTPDGRLDEVDFNRKLSKYAQRVALVAITGASNVTGFINPVHKFAEMAHAVGAQIAVDAAQLAPHRKVDMRSLGDPAHLDYVVLSAHKMYAPFGTGALIGPRQTFARGTPALVGGGTVNFVTLEDVSWANPPDRDEAGSPNVIGAVALAAAIHQLEEIGMDAVAQHEAELTEHLLNRLPEIPGVTIFGDKEGRNAANRLGVVAFLLEGLSHFLIAAILGYEFGIGVRNGCFCAHPYLLSLLAISGEQAELTHANMLAGDRTDMPGLVRISFGLYNTIDEIDTLVEALARIAQGEYSGNYVQEEATGEFHPKDWQPDFESYFRL